ncbi:hypothetical protein MKK75_13355 [Methylobacterium sp. J-030]|uniref:hypothetical protein n=1 Tax=Methylobacterium sp. J-030 TaxID=2836627 RepID=UPI001FBB41FB|nr:hypothetical protein [Methylobacterium sp. J-030]MCJ2069765.1 hypothetical protein [Methylobacterium sp. J-030]
MADLINFPAKPRSRHARRTYQVHRLAPSGGVVATCIITARDDGDATRQAQELIAGHRAELWASNRLVAVLGTFDFPIATTIRVLADQPTTEG